MLFFSLNAFHKARDKAAAGGQKTSANFTAMLCFLQALSSAKAQKNPSKLELRQQLCLFLFGFFLFVFTTDILGASLSKLSPSLHKLLSNPMELLQGSNLSEVPISFWHIDVLWDLEEELIPPGLAPLFFFSNFLSPNFSGNCGFLSRQTPSWRECSAQHWLETTAVRGTKRILETCPGPEQARIRDIVTRGATDKISSAVRTSTFLTYQVLWSRKVWFSLELWNGIELFSCL